MSRLSTVVLLWATVLLFSCKTSQEIGRTKSKLEKLSPEEIATKNAIQPRLESALAIKSKVYFKTPKMSDSFKMHIRMKRDSIIWISATYYKVEVARFVFTQDSVKMIDRKNEKYFEGGYNFIQNLYNVPFNFSSLQATILGEPFDHTGYKKIRAYVSKNNYIVAGLSELKYQKPNGDEKSQQQVFTEWYSENDFKLLKSKISESKTKKSFTAEITERKLIDEVSIPLKAAYEVKAEEHLTFRSENLKITLPERQSYPFKISSKYEPMF